MTINIKYPSSAFVCVPILGDWVPLGMYHFYPFSPPPFILVHFDSSSNSSNANCHRSSICVKNIVIPIVVVVVVVVFIILLLFPLFLLLLLFPCPSSARTPAAAAKQQ